MLQIYSQKVSNYLNESEQLIKDNSFKVGKNNKRVTFNLKYMAI